MFEKIHQAQKGYRWRGGLTMLALIPLMALGTPHPSTLPNSARNAPPTAPIIISGPFLELLVPGQLYDFTAVCPWDDFPYLVQLRFAWGDGDTSDWSSPPIPFGIPVTLSHAFADPLAVYFVKAQARDMFGAESEWSLPWPVITPVTSQPVMQQPGLTIRPTQFNPTTEIRYTLPQADKVRIRVFTILGREIATLMDDWQPAGNHAVIFDGSNLPSGVYLCTLETPDYRTVGKMILIK